jgi:threonine synthase
VFAPSGLDAQTFRTSCTGCGKPLGPAFSPFCPDCGAMSDVEYNLDVVEFRDSSNPYIRFGDLLPVADRGLLPEGAVRTPTVHAGNLGCALGMPHLYLKDETKLPTGTTKDRMAAVALAYLYERGVRGFCTSSTGNTSTAYIHAISRMPELTLYLFTASRFHDRVHRAAEDQVVHFVLKDATFVEAFDAARDFAIEHGLVAERGFCNPGRREGLKLAWLEAVEQVPRPIDWYVQAVSSAMGVYGVFKGAKELRALGRSDRVPRLLCVQQETCAPMVSAWADGSDRIRPRDIVHRPSGIAEAILRGNPTAAYPHVRRFVVESGGTFVAVREEEIREARVLVERLEGIDPCFSAAAAVAGAIKLRRRGELPSDDTVLINLTGRDRHEPSSIRRIHWLRRSRSGWMPEARADEPSRRLWSNPREAMTSAGRVNRT